MIQRNYLQIRQEVEDLVAAEMERILSDPGMVGIMLKKTWKKGFGIGKIIFRQDLARINFIIRSQIFLFLLTFGWH